MLEELKYDHVDVMAESQKIKACNKVGEQRPSQAGLKKADVEFGFYKYIGQLLELFKQ